MGYKFMQFWWGEAFNASPLKPWKMKLQSHVRGQNGGFWGCPAQLDHFQVANTCISRVYTCLQCWECQNITFYIFVTQRCVRSQSRGSWGCQTQLDHCHMYTMCISRVYTCPPWYEAKWSYRGMWGVKIVVLGAAKHKLTICISHVYISII